MVVLSFGWLLAQVPTRFRYGSPPGMTETVGARACHPVKAVDAVGMICARDVYS